MPKLIKKGQVVSNPWQLLPQEATLAECTTSTADHLLVPLQVWNDSKDELKACGKTIGVWLDSDELPDSLSAEDLAALPLIALNFPAFTDGRSFSHAVTLRQRLAYRGELRAIGDVLRDQLFFMERCGFDSFDVADGVKEEDALSAFNDFSDIYASTVAEPAPLFRRRA